MFRYMPRAGYRQGEKRVDVWLSTAGHAHLGELAGVWECSLSDAVVRLVQEEVGRRGVGGVGAGVGRSAASDGGRSGLAAGRGGEGVVGVGVDLLDDPFVASVLHPEHAASLSVVPDPLEEIA